MKIWSLVTSAVRSIKLRGIAQGVMSSIHLLARNVNSVISLQLAMFKIIQYVMIIMKMLTLLIDLQQKNDRKPPPGGFLLPLQQAFTESL
ncbi:TPA: hypothetical protein ACNVQT_001511 [Citrobacter farmeri]|nr:hypothetical protein [Citrobacter farmeri]